MLSKFTARYANAGDNACQAAWRDLKSSITPSEADTVQTTTGKYEDTVTLLPESSINPAWVRHQRGMVGINFATVKMEEVEKPDYLAAYNAWLKEYLLGGGKATHFYDYPCPHMKVVTDGRCHRGRDNGDRILLRDIDAREYYDITANNSDYRNMHRVFGWTKQGKKPVTYGIYVPVYTNTIDKEMMYDKSVPKKVRRRILNGIAKSKEESRASDLYDSFRRIDFNLRRAGVDAHTQNRHRGNAEYFAQTLKAYVASTDASNATALNYSMFPMYVDFSNGDGWSFKRFLSEKSDFYYFKDTDPAAYLADLVECQGSVTVTFINKESAVVTKVDESDDVPLPLICLTAEMPLNQDLTGYSYTIDSVILGKEGEPAAVTFQMNDCLIES